jgi:hypothetical protein
MDCLRSQTEAGDTQANPIRVELYLNLSVSATFAIAKAEKGIPSESAAAQMPL